MRTAQKPEKLGSLIKKLDTQVSLFVRLNAADQFGSVRCISCQEKIWWADSDCAHFKDRDNMATRYYIPNLAPACQGCNRYNHYWHIEQWEKRLTPEMVIHLEFISHGLQKFTRFELEEMLSDFTSKVKELRKQKHL